MQCYISLWTVVKYKVDQKWKYSMHSSLSLMTDYLLTFKFVTYLDHSSCSVEEMTVLFNKPKIYANLALIVLSTPQMNVSIDLFINDLAHRGKWNNLELRFVTFSQFSCVACHIPKYHFSLHSSQFCQHVLNFYLRA